MVCDFNLNSQIAGHKFAARLTGKAREHVNNLLEAEDTLYGDECSVSQSVGLRDIRIEIRVRLSLLHSEGMNVMSVWC